MILCGEDVHVKDRTVRIELNLVDWLEYVVQCRVSAHKLTSHKNLLHKNLFVSAQDSSTAQIPATKCKMEIDQEKKRKQPGEETSNIVNIEKKNEGRRKCRSCNGN